jgi:hypothetical protein
MKKILMIFAILTASFSLNAQTINDTVAINGVKPQIKIKVNKIYDENGNVIGYDSTYVWSYSNSSSNNNFIVINPDSLISKFKPYFDENFNGVPLDPFDNKFFSDSTMFFDFFNNDHFFDKWQNELFNFQKEIERMDSLKEIFFKKYMENMDKKQNEKIY